MSSLLSQSRARARTLSRSGFALLCLWIVAGSGPARATPLFDLVFVSTTGAGAPGGNQIAGVPGDVVTLELRLMVGSDGVSSYAVSLEFDSDLRDELDLVSVTELLPLGFGFSFTPDELELVVDSTDTRIGRLYTFEAATLGLGPASRGFAIGRIELRLGSGLAKDGPDLFFGFFNAGVDGIFDNDGRDLAPTARLTSASVDRVPEPLVPILLALAFGAVRAARSTVRLSS